MGKIYIEHLLSTVLKRRKCRKRGREKTIFLKKKTAIEARTTLMLYVVIGIRLATYLELKFGVLMMF